MQQLFQDSMAIIREWGKPDIFLTMTCYPNWPEILAELKDVTNEAEKLTIIARIFRLKLRALLVDILKNQVFGKVKAYMYVVEFQKRGLPHADILLILDEHSKPRTTEDFDHIVSAEIPDINIHPQAYETVTKCMFHVPCGKLHPKAPCMENDQCSKR